jgi:hypothetical protein
MAWYDRLWSATPLRLDVGRRGFPMLSRSDLAVFGTQPWPRSILSIMSPRN